MKTRVLPGISCDQPPFRPYHRNSFDISNTFLHISRSPPPRRSPFFLSRHLIHVDVLIRSDVMLGLGEHWLYRMNVVHLFKYNQKQGQKFRRGWRGQKGKSEDLIRKGKDGTQESCIIAPTNQPIWRASLLSFLVQRLGLSWDTRIGLGKICTTFCISITLKNTWSVRYLNEWRESRK